MKKISALFLSLCLSLSLVTPCFATSLETISIDNGSVTVETVEPRAATVPTEYHNLSGGDYEATLDDLAATKSSLTKYYFSTGSGKIYLDFDLEWSGKSSDKTRKINVILYEGDGVGSWVESDVDNISVTFTGTTTARQYFRGDRIKFCVID